MRDKQDRKGLRRRNIMQAAMELFMENGYLNTKVSDIADRCEIGKGTFYEYFPSKQELLLELLKSSVLEEEVSVVNAVREAGTTRDKLVAYVSFQKDLMQRLGTSPLELLQQVQTWGWDSENAKVFFGSISKIAEEYYDCLLSIIQFGIEKGELCDIAKPHMVATAMNGAIHNFVEVFSEKFCRNKCSSLSKDECSKTCDLARERENWNTEEFVDMLCGGYLKNQAV